MYGDSSLTPRGLIVLHAWWGLNPEIQKQAQQMAEEGNLVTMVPDLYRGKVAKGELINIIFKIIVKNIKFSPSWKLCVATATHNFKWVKITRICLMGDETFANLDVLKTLFVRNICDFNG